MGLYSGGGLISRLISLLENRGAYIHGLTCIPVTEGILQKVYYFTYSQQLDRKKNVKANLHQSQPAEGRSSAEPRRKKQESKIISFFYAAKEVNQ